MRLHNATYDVSVLITRSMHDALSCLPLCNGGSNMLYQTVENFVCECEEGAHARNTIQGYTPIHRALTPRCQSFHWNGAVHVKVSLRMSFALLSHV
jgi:hypothetical protein